SADRLRRLGAHEVLPRLEIPEQLRPLGSTRWAAAIDSVGGRQLAIILSAIEYGGIVAASGLTGGTDVPTTVMPFILRAVTLAGIASVQMPIDDRRSIWTALAGPLKPRHLDATTRT